TIPAIVQRVLQDAPRKITVYNFGIEGATLEAELLTLQRFRETYALDEVLFYTGSNDVLKYYKTIPGGWRKFDEFFSSRFELEKTARALYAAVRGVEASGLARPKSETKPSILQDNTPLRDDT